MKTRELLREHLARERRLARVAAELRAVLAADPEYGLAMAAAARAGGHKSRNRTPPKPTRQQRNQAFSHMRAKG